MDEASVTENASAEVVLPGEAELAEHISAILAESDLVQTSLGQVRAAVEIRLGFAPGALDSQRERLGLAIQEEIARMHGKNDETCGSSPSKKRKGHPDCGDGEGTETKAAKYDLTGPEPAGSLDLEVVEKVLARFKAWCLAQGKSEALVKDYVKNFMCNFKQQHKCLVAMAQSDYVDWYKKECTAKEKKPSMSQLTSLRIFQNFWQEELNGVPVCAYLEFKADVRRLKAKLKKMKEQKGKPTKDKSATSKQKDAIAESNGGGEALNGSPDSAELQRLKAELKRELRAELKAELMEALKLGGGSLESRVALADTDEVRASAQAVATEATVMRPEPRTGVATTDDAARSSALDPTKNDENASVARDREASSEAGDASDVSDDSD